jgi:predicted nucleic acid-binding protein
MRVLVVLIDSDVIVDSLTDREPWTSAAKSILEKCYNGELQGYIAAHSIPNIYYILRKTYTDDERRKRLLELCDIVLVVGINGLILREEPCRNNLTFWSSYFLIA